MGLRTLQIDMDMTVVYANTYDESLLITIHDRTSKLKGCLAQTISCMHFNNVMI